jgi:hypothetical protein
MRCVLPMVALFAAAPVGAQAPRLTLAQVYARLGTHSPRLAIAAAEAKYTEGRGPRAPSGLVPIRWAPCDGVLAGSGASPAPSAADQNLQEDT